MKASELVKAARAMPDRLLTPAQSLLKPGENNPGETALQRAAKGKELVKPVPVRK